MKSTCLLLLLCACMVAACQRPVSNKPEAITTIVAIKEVVDTVELNNQLYSALAGGLPVRSKPDTGAPVIGKIDYGAVVNLLPPADPADTLALPSDTLVRVVVGGTATHWVPVVLDKDTGYVIDAYLSNYLPPAAGTPDLGEWAKAIGEPYGKAFVSRPKVRTPSSDGIGVYRQLYNNGTVYSEARGHEYFKTSLQLPNTTVLKVLNSLRNLKEFGGVLGIKTPLKKGIYTVADSTITDGYRWITTYDPTGTYLESVSISWSEGSYNTLTIKQLETEAVVYYSTGV